MTLIRTTMAAGLVAGMVAGDAAARQQPETPPPPTEPLKRPPAESIKPTRTGAPPPPEPAGPRMKDDAIPGLEDSDFRIGAAPLRSEGTFLTLKRGSMLNLPGGERVFVYHKDEKGQRERPMVLVPSQTLQRMEQIAQDRTEPPIFVVSGQVFVYQGVNYLLPTNYRIASGESEAPVADPPKTVPKPAVPAKPPTERPTLSDPAVQDLIHELERQREASRASEARAARPDPEKKAETTRPAAESALIPEGQTVVRRRGRLIRSDAGDWAFVFDRGLSGEAGTDRPLIVTPTLNLQRMEAWVAKQGETATFELSGRVLAYQGRNYIVPTMYQVYTPNDLEPRQ